MTVIGSLNAKNTNIDDTGVVMKDGILFVDVEWNRYYQGECKANGIIEVGAVSNNIPEDSLFYYLKPKSYIPDRISSFLNVSFALLENRGASKEKALAELSKRISSYDRIMVWSGDTFGLLMDVFNKDTFEGKEICILQDVLADKVGKKLSYEGALKTYEIEYDPISLHNSKYDAECLMQLYGKSVLGIDIKIAPSSGGIHRMKGKAMDRKKIEELLEYYNCSYTLSDNHVTVITNCSQWSIYLKNGFVKSLYHENHKPPKGIHSHNLSRHDFYSVLKYVLGHDASGRTEDRAKTYERDARINAARKKRQKERRLVDEKLVKQRGKYYEWG